MIDGRAGPVTTGSPTALFTVQSRAVEPSRCPVIRTITTSLGRAGMGNATLLRCVRGHKRWPG